MIISLLCFAVILLIAYWWADAGALSSFLHFACVVTAGAVAFAAWEPLAYLLLGGGAGGVAHGAALLGVFLAALLVLRMVADRAIPFDIPLPKPANLGIGAVFGALSGVLSVGTLLIGAGFVQSTVTVFDLTGWSRRSDVPSAPTIGSDEAPILHVVDATAAFYEFLSWGAFAAIPVGGAAGSLGTHAPELSRTALSLHRDSFFEGMARNSIQPEAVTSLKVLDVASATLASGVNAAPKPAWGVEFGVSQEGFDGNGTQFVVSASQIRLIGDGKGGKAAVAHPVSWTQPDRNGNTKQYFFNSATSYACSVESQGDGRFLALFAKDALKGQAPRFVEIKGVRFKAPAATAVAAAIDDGSSRKVAVFRDPDATDISADVEFPNPKYSIKGVTINTNARGGLEIDGSNYIVRGEQKFPKSNAGSVPPELQVRGFKINDGECIMRIDVSAKAGGARIFPDLNSWVTDAGPEAQAAKVAVVDETGARYYATGFVYDDNEYVLVKSFGGSPIALKFLPVQSLGGNTQLTLYFRVPNETKFAGLVLATPKEDRLVNTLSATSPKRGD